MAPKTATKAMKARKTAMKAKKKRMKATPTATMKADAYRLVAETTGLTAKEAKDCIENLLAKPSQGVCAMDAYIAVANATGLTPDEVKVARESEMRSQQCKRCQCGRCKARDTVFEQHT